MGTSKSGGARRRRGLRLLGLLLVCVGALYASTTGVADEPVIEPAESAGGFAWRPSAVTVPSGGTVAFRNPGYYVPHGVAWTGGPATPSCNGVPVNSSGTAWSGTCTFAQAGTYTFVCTVHPQEMKGTITVSAGEAPPVSPAPAPTQPPDSPQGRAFEDLRLARVQHGDAVRGSLVVSAVAAGGRLKVELGAKRASLGGTGRGTVRVGHLIRPQVEAGRQAFTVPLGASARGALQRHGSVAVTVQILVAPPSGSPTKATRKVELHR